MMHRAWSSIVEVPYCFSMSYVKFQGHTALKIVEFDPNWAFPDCNSSFNSPMAMKCCTKLETAKERCPIVFQGHPSNFKVTRYKTSPILTQIERFRTIGRSQLSNPPDLPCCTATYRSHDQKYICISCDTQRYRFYSLIILCIPIVSRPFVSSVKRSSYVRVCTYGTISVYLPIHKWPPITWWHGLWLKFCGPFS